MPFLRRRGNMASDTDMRRHSLLDGLTVPKLPPARSESTSDLPALAPVAEGTPPTTAPASPVETAPDRASTSSSIHVPDRPASPEIQPESHKHRRFSMLRFRNASDSQLAAKAKLHAAAQKAPPLPRPPEIITTAPTFDEQAGQKQPSRLKLAARIRRSGEMARTEPLGEPDERIYGRRNRQMSQVPEEASPGKQSVTFDEPKRPASSQSPPAYGEDHSSTLALPVNRLSESSRSDASSGERVYGSTTTTTHTVHTTTTIFRLPRRNRKQPESLFPISHLPQKGKASSADVSNSSLAVPPSESVNGSPTRSPQHSQLTPTPSRPSTSTNGLSTPPTTSVGLFSRPNASPATAFFRPSSRQSGSSSPTRALRHKRGRSSTLSSLGRDSPRPSMDEHLAPPTTRTSSSTGRRSFGDLLGLNRLRQNSDSNGRQGTLTPATPGSSTSKNNSLHLPRDSIILPERRDDDTPSRYLERLLEVVSRSVIAAAVSKSTDNFSQSVLRSYMRSFKFFEDPMDMAIRKLLMDAELPKETQQIDRCLQAFANRYHECNPGIYANPDQAYFIAFSLLILHTDVFNKNNKHKMQKADYLKNTRGEGIFDEILEVFYDNITYTPFIHVEDDFDINGERIVAHKAKKKSIFPNGGPDPARRVAKEPIDPYTLIIDNRLDILRPNLKDVMHLDDPYSYLGTAKSLNLKELQKTFFKTGVLQIISARSRPDAFMSDKAATNPEDASPGIVDIKITKVGILWRKDVKKKKTRSPWQEWGAILTGAQLYFFRNVTWIKSLMHQYEDHIKKGHDGDPCIFKPPLDQFKPDNLMSTDGAVALMDATYKKHKHAFVYVRHGGFEEVLLAEDDAEMNDWLAKLNYAAAFRTSGVRMRGVVGSGYDGQGRRAIRRLDTDSIQTPTGEVTIARSKIDHKMAQDILAARRAIMMQKVADANEKLKEAEKTLDAQLRNSRHLQLLAPIQPKTREQMLLSAARMAAQLKWTRVDIWRLKCHRDILLLDLEEERQLLGFPAETALDGLLTPARSPAKEEPNTEPATQKSSQSPTQLSLTRTSTTTRSDDDSPRTEVFQTPPTSATGSSFHRSQNSWELPGLTFDHVDLRKASVSSAVSSNMSASTSPPRTKPASVPPREKAKFNDGDDVDADEHDLLEQTGLIGPEKVRTPDQKTAQSTAEGGEGVERHERHSTGAGDRHDRNKIRRSLQRTLREGAGHISHHRSRKGRDSASSGAMSDETARDASDVLSRGTGSFVVHGKKASVITFNDLQMQSLSPEERIRQWKLKEEIIQPGSSSTSSRGVAGEVADFRSVLTARSASEAGREHRGSAASASTATARSFRDLHRKYSSAQAAKGLVSTGNLTLPSDEDSDAAVSFSDGRRTPLPPIEGEPSEYEDVAEPVLDADGSPPPSRDNRQTMFFTPEPASSPVAEASRPTETDQVSVREEEKLPSPSLQAVGA
ncbi:protein transport protein sec73 [Echria macrotheca]|uniref:Protein transport protein sec73 n=1 Tax=Echria macrotheca TaxID=438768 RepID=A0AAJ0BPG3_9PEZI|nr:protein transport protein sec73 [Echria macrotheca]